MAKYYTLGPLKVEAESRDVNLLQPEMKRRLLEAKKQFEMEAVVKGTQLLVYCTYRPMCLQAVLYRTTRTKAEIEQRIRVLTKQGYTGLAAILEKVGPQGSAMHLGKHKTNAAPGESYHQYGLAADCVPVIHGKAEWNPKSPEWDLYGDVLLSNGLAWSGQWTGFLEKPHCQLSSYPKALLDPKIPDIAVQMARRVLVDQDEPRGLMDLVVNEIEQAATIAEQAKA